MKKSLGIFLFIFTILWSQATSNTFAHILKTDGSIGAVIHVEPADDPIVGEPSPFFFEFKDKENKFKPEDCECIVTITNGTGSVVLRQQLFSTSQDPSLSNASFTYTFPEKDIYKVEVNGSPKSTGTFQSFKITYDLRVSRLSQHQGSASQASNHETNKWPYILLASALLVILFIFVAKSKLTNGHKIIAIFFTLSVLLHTLPSTIFAFHHTSNLMEKPSHPCCLANPIDVSEPLNVPVILNILSIQPNRPITHSPSIISNILNKSPPLPAA